MAMLVYRRVYYIYIYLYFPMIFHDISMFVGEIPFNVLSQNGLQKNRRQVGDEVTKDEPLTTNPNVGGFGQAPVVIPGANAGHKNGHFFIRNTWAWCIYPLVN